MNQSKQNISKFQAWILASRPKTLPAAVAPVIVGSSIAYSVNSFRLLPAVAAMLGAIFIQIGANLANDVFDYERGVDTTDRIGPLRVTLAGLLSPNEMRAGLGFVFGLACLAGVYLVFLGGLPVFIIGVFSILAAIAYTAGPFPLSRNGLADIFVILFFGFVAVGGTTFVQSGYLPPVAWYAGFAIGCLTNAILVVNNTRDIESDGKSGRRTIPVVFGRNAGVIEFTVMLVIGYAAVFFLFLGQMVSQWGLLVFITIPNAFDLVRKLKNHIDGPTLNHVLAHTARFLVVYSLLFSAGLIFT